MFSLLRRHVRPRLRPGLTLLELLVVLVAIGILAALGFVAYGQVMERAYQAAMLNDLRNFATARSLYVSEQESYPAAVAEVGEHNYTESVFEIDYWNGGPFYSLVVGHRKTETVCSVTEYEGEGYWIGCERKNRLEFEALAGDQYLEMDYDAQAGIVAVGITPADIQRVSWSYGNGKTSGGGAEHQTVSHVYEQSGKYRVQLVVLPKKGRMRVGYRDVQVGSTNTEGAPPVAEFDLYEVVGDTSSTVASLQQSAPEGASYAASPSWLERFKAYAAEALTATVELGSVYGDTVFIPVGARVELDGSPSFDPAGRKIVSYKWSFSGLSTRLDGRVVRHLWNTEPTVTLTVKNDLGLTSSRTKHVKFLDPGVPVADFTMDPNPVDLNAPVAFDASRSLHTGIRRMMRYHWEFAPGDTAMGPRVSRRFSTAGEKEVTLTVTDDRGQSASWTDTLTVRNLSVVANWDFCRSYGSGTVQDVVSGLDFTLQQFENAYPVPWSDYWRAGPPASLQLDSISLSHPQIWGTLASPGRTARDYTLFFLLNPRSNQAATEYFFTRDNDGTSSLVIGRTTTGALHISANGISYTLGSLPAGAWNTVAVQFRPGTSATAKTLEIFINGVSQGVTTTSMPSVQLNHKLSLGSGGNRFTDYRYYFGGRLSSTRYYEGVPTAAQVQEIQAEMMAQTSAGCASLNNVSTDARFTYSPKNPLVADTVRFDASASMAPDGIVEKYEWDFGDWTTRTSATPLSSHVYSAPGKYEVTLTVTDRKGNTSTARQRVDVFPAATLVANWDACNSYGNSTLANTISGMSGFTLQQFETSYPIAWSNYWRKGPPPSLLMDSTSTARPQIWGSIASPGRTATEYTLFFLIKPRSDQTATEYFFGRGTDGSGKYLVLARTAAGALHMQNGVGSHTLGSIPAGVWSAVAVQMRSRGAGVSTVLGEVFVNGASQGVVSFSPVALSQALTLGKVTQSSMASSIFRGSVSSTRYYEGYLPAGKVAEVQQAMLGTTRWGCDRLNNATTEARFTYSPELPYANQSVTFDASISAMPHPVVSYAWDWGDFTQSTVETAKTTHVYTTPGIYTVRLTVTDSQGRTATTDRTLQVHAPAVLSSHWDVCASYRSGLLKDTQGSLTVTLSQDTTSPVPWFLYTPRSNPASLDFSQAGTPRLRARTPTAGRTATDYTLFLLVKPRANQTATEYFFARNTGDNKSIVMGRKTNGDLHVQFNAETPIPLGTLPADVWSTVAVQMRSRPTGINNAYVEVFVNGDSRGIYLSSPPVPLATVLNFGDYGNMTWGVQSNLFRGSLGESRYYEGYVTPERIREIHREILSADCAFPSNELPTASFAISPNPIGAGEWITYDGRASSDLDGVIVSYQWKFQKCQMGTGIGSEPCILEDVLAPTSGSVVSFQLYNEETPITGILTVTDNDGNRNTLEKTINVGGTWDFKSRFRWSPSRPAVGESVSFDGSESTDRNGIRKYTWTFRGAGSGGADLVQIGETLAYPSVSWPTAGIYDVTLTVHNAAGDSVSTTQPVPVGQVVENLPPVAKIAYLPRDVVAGDTVTFDGTGSYDPDGSIASYAWQLPGGVTATSSVVKAVLPEGTQPVSLTVTDNSGQTNKAGVSVVVGPRDEVVTPPQDSTASTTGPLIAVLEASPNPGYLDQDVRFEGRNSYDPAHPFDLSDKLICKWETGDGTVYPYSSNCYISHRYAQSGTYTAKLTVMNEKGQTGTAKGTIEIGGNYPRFAVRGEPKDQYLQWVGCPGDTKNVQVKGTLYDANTGQVFLGSYTEGNVHNNFLQWAVLSGPGKFASPSPAPGDLWPSGEGPTIALTGDGVVTLGVRHNKSGTEDRITIRSKRVPPQTLCGTVVVSGPGGGTPYGYSGDQVASLEITSAPSIVSLNNLQDETYSIRYVARDKNGKAVRADNLRFRLVRVTYMGRMPSPVWTSRPEPGVGNLRMWGPTDARGTGYFEVYTSLESRGPSARWPVEIYCGMAVTTCKK